MNSCSGVTFYMIPQKLNFSAGTHNKPAQAKAQMVIILTTTSLFSVHVMEMFFIFSALHSGRDIHRMCLCCRCNCPYLPTTTPIRKAQEQMFRLRLLPRSTKANHNSSNFHSPQRLSPTTFDSTYNVQWAWAGIPCRWHHSGNKIHHSIESYYSVCKSLEKTVSYLFMC